MSGRLPFTSFLGTGNDFQRISTVARWFFPFIIQQKPTGDKKE
jgi:hypothetical protein